MFPLSLAYSAATYTKTRTAFLPFRTRGSRHALTYCRSRYGAKNVVIHVSVFPSLTARTWNLSGTPNVQMVGAIRCINAATRAQDATSQKSAVEENEESPLPDTEQKPSHQKIDGSGVSTVMRRLITLSRPEWPLILGAAATLGVTSSITLLLPYASGKVIDVTLAAESSGAYYTPPQLAAGLFGLTAVAGVGVFVRSYLLTVAGNRIVERLRKNLYGATLAQETAFFDRVRTGDLLSRLSSDAVLIQRSVTVEAVGALRAVVMSLGSSVLLVWSSPSLAAVSLCSLPPVFLAARYFGRKIKDQQTRVQEKLADATDVAEETISSIRTVRQFAAEAFELEKYGRVLGEAHTSAIQAGQMQAVFDGSMHVAANAAVLGVMGYGGTMVMNGEMSGGDLAGFLMYSLLMAGNVSSLSSTYAEMSKALAASERIFKIIDRTPEIPPSFDYKSSFTNDNAFIGGEKIVSKNSLEPRNNAIDGSTHKKTKPLSISFHNVNFSYPSRPDVRILSELTFDIHPGENVAFVGASGSGKSTIASLLTRLYDISADDDNDGGKILLGGVDIRTLDPGVLRDTVGIVSQEPLLFSTTIANNIRYGCLTASEEDLTEAARASNVLDFVQNLPEGLETPVGSRGTQVSGGQKQRIAIARTLLKNPPVVIFDEATSALDAESERVVQAAVTAFMRDGQRTVLSIAHRLSSIKTADRIFVLKDGRISEHGTFEELSSKSQGDFVDLMGRQLTVGAQR